MSLEPLPSRSKADRKVPILVVLVILYQLAKAVFFGWVFWQCWQTQGSGVPPFGEVAAHNPFFESPLFLLWVIIGLFHAVVGFGLLSLGNWARACSLLPLLSLLPWWVLVHAMGVVSLQFPVAFSTMLAAIAAELIAIGILYVTPEARQAFAPTSD